MPLMRYCLANLSNKFGETSITIEKAWQPYDNSQSHSTLLDFPTMWRFTTLVLNFGVNICVNIHAFGSFRSLQFLKE